MTTTECEQEVRHQLACVTNADLHMHTIYSDGIMTPADIVRLAGFNGLEMIAITDHDTMAGYAEAKAEAKKWGITVVPGVEVTTLEPESSNLDSNQDKGLHILGYNVDPQDRLFQNFLKESRWLQYQRTAIRVDLLRQAGLPITIEKVVKACPASRLGKYNILMTMMQDPETQECLREKHGHMTWLQLYDAYLGKNTAAGTVTGASKYVIDTIKAIHDAGGIAVVAHPFKDITSVPERRDAYLETLAEQGIDGFEIQPAHGGRNDPYIAFAKEHGMLLTRGSDYHGAVFDRKMLKPIIL